MSRARPTPSCSDIPFVVPCALEPPAQVALEDYARVLTAAVASEVVESAPGVVSGVHVCGLSGGLASSAARDIGDFAKELVAAGPGGGLGWS